VGYRRIHGELAVLGIKVAASTVWETLKEHGIPPAPERQGTTWAEFPRSQAEALLARDLFEVRTLTGARLYVFAIIEHSTRRIRSLGQAAPLRPLPDPISMPAQIRCLRVRRRDRLGGTLREYRHAS
jgi:hypothetical protein